MRKKGGRGERKREAPRWRRGPHRIGCGKGRPRSRPSRARPPATQMDTPGRDPIVQGGAARRGNDGVVARGPGAGRPVWGGGPRGCAAVPFFFGCPFSRLALPPPPAHGSRQGDTRPCPPAPIAHGPAQTKAGGTATGRGRGGWVRGREPSPCEGGRRPRPGGHFACSFLLSRPPPLPPRAGDGRTGSPATDAIPGESSASRPWTPGQKAARRGGEAGGGPSSACDTHLFFSQ